MILAYIDESGTSYKKNADSGFFKDGPYSIWVCVLINEKKYFDIEKSFQELASHTLPKSLQKKELHACDIWEKRSENVETENKIRKYFEELSQLTSKLRIPILVGIQQKNPSISNKGVNKKKEELERAQYSLITLLEHKLAEINETAVLVSDEESNTTGEELRKLVTERTKWRYSNTNKKIKGKQPKYLFEYRSNFILDQLHYVDSKSSLLTQFSDNICFIIRKSLEHLYLLNFPNNTRPEANVKYVPISEETFNSFIHFSKVAVACFDPVRKDVNIGELSNISDVYYNFKKPSNLTTLVLPQKPMLTILKMFTPYN